MSSKIRKFSAQLHIWLGLASGIVVFIVCITGCMYVFRDEINDFTQPWKFIEPQDKPFLSPSLILDIAATEVKDISPWAVTYGENYDAVFVDYFGTDKSYTVYIDPYDGQVIKTVAKKKDDFDFFRFLLTGHRSLWLPLEIGKSIVGWSILLFAITLITGMILWWPKRWTKKTLKRNLTFRRHAPWSRINFDLHNVLGGYFFLILLIISLTGLIWSFGWFSKSVYYITSGGKDLKPYVLPKSDTLQRTTEFSGTIDKLYLQLRDQEPNAKTFYFALPMKDDGVIRVSIVHKRGSYYQTDNLFFDQYTLQSLEGQGPYAGRYTEASTADKIRRMNLEIHDGRILGLFGKILAFISSLIGASLPITGFVIWYRKRKK